MKKDKNVYLKLFFTTFYISAFTFGGGFVIISLMQKIFVEKLKWVKEEEMLNYISIAQSSPGVIAVNASILLGYHTGGFFGALVTILGTVLPPMLIISAITFFYESFRNNIVVSAVLKGMQAGVAAVIADVALTMGNGITKTKDFISISLMVICFVLIYFFKVNIGLIIPLCGLIGAIRAIVSAKKGDI